MDLTQIAVKIKQRRMEKGWTQRELAERLNVSGQLVSKWETGEGVPSLEYFNDLCAVLDVPFSYFTDEAPSAPASDAQSSPPKKIRKPFNFKLFWIVFGSAAAAVVLLAIGLLTPFVFIPAANKRKYDAEIDAACSAYFRDMRYYNIHMTTTVDGDEEDDYVYAGYFDDDGGLVSYNSQKGTTVYGELSQYKWSTDAVQLFTMPSGVETLEDWAAYDMFGDVSDDVADTGELKYIRKEKGGYYFEPTEASLLEDFSGTEKKKIQVKSAHGYVKTDGKYIRELTLTAKFHIKKEDIDSTVTTKVEFLRERPVIDTTALEDIELTEKTTIDEFVSILTDGKAKPVAGAAELASFGKTLYDGGKYLYENDLYGNLTCYDTADLSSTLTVALSDGEHTPFVYVYGDYVYWQRYPHNDANLYRAPIRDISRSSSIGEKILEDMRGDGRYIYGTLYNQNNCAVYDCEKGIWSTYDASSICFIDSSGYVYAVRDNAPVYFAPGANTATAMNGTAWKSTRYDGVYREGDDVFTAGGGQLYRYRKGKLVKTCRDGNVIGDSYYTLVTDGMYHKVGTSALVDASGTEVRSYDKVWAPSYSGYAKSHVWIDEVLCGKFVIGSSAGIMDTDGYVLAWTDVHTVDISFKKVGARLLIGVDERLWIV